MSLYVKYCIAIAFAVTLVVACAPAGYDPNATPSAIIVPATPTPEKVVAHTMHDGVTCYTWRDAISCVKN